MSKVRLVMSYGFCSNFLTLYSSVKDFENQLRFDKGTECLKVDFFETQCSLCLKLDAC